MTWRVLAVALALLVGMVALPARAQNEIQATCPTSIPFGEVFDCSLSAAGEVDKYTFTANTNDVFTFRALRTSGTFSMRIRVFDAGLALVAGCSDATSPRAAFTCTMTSSGTFTLHVEDYFSNATGNYIVYGQKLNGVVNAQPATLGQLYTADLATSIEMDAYTFDAQINDQIEFRLHRLSGAFSVRIGIYNQNGERVCYDAGDAKATIL